VEAAVAGGRDVLFDVDWQGGQQIRNSALRDAAVSIFILPPSIAALEERLIARGQDSAEVVARAHGEVAGRDQPLGRVRLRAGQRDPDALRGGAARDHRRRAAAAERRPGLVGFVAGLNREFEARLG
jgi:guanylate kinase